MVAVHELKRSTVEFTAANYNATFAQADVLQPLSPGMSDLTASIRGSFPALILSAVWDKGGD